MTDKPAVPSVEVGRMLDNVDMFASKERSRPILCEIELTVDDDTLI